MEIKNLTEKYLPNIEISTDDSEYQIQEHCFRYAKFKELGTPLLVLLSVVLKNVANG